MVQQPIQTHILVPSQFQRVGHQVQGFQGGRIEFHVLREIVVAQPPLAVVGRGAGYIEV